MMDVKKGIVNRFTIIYLFMVFGGLMIFFKIVYLQTFEKEKWDKFAGKLSQKDLLIPALRGDI